MSGYCNEQKSQAAQKTRQQAVHPKAQPLPPPTPPLAPASRTATSASPAARDLSHPPTAPPPPNPATELARPPRPPPAALPAKARPTAQPDPQPAVQSRRQPPVKEMVLLLVKLAAVPAKALPSLFALQQAHQQNTIRPVGHHPLSYPRSSQSQDNGSIESITYRKSLRPRC